MNIKGKKIFLRSIERDDLPILQKWANDPDVQYMLGGWHFPTNMQDQERWFNSLSTNSLNQRFAIEAPELGLIGSTNLVDIDWKNKHGFHGIMLGDKDIRGKGFGIDTAMTIARYAFDELGLERLDGSMIEYNQISLNLYLNKLGWKEEGRQRKWYFRQGRFWDKIIVGLLKEDYYELVKNNNYWNE